MRYFICDKEFLVRADNTAVELFINGKWVTQGANRNIDNILEVIRFFEVEEVTESQAKLFLL
jgi:hypothetical protein